MTSSRPVDKGSSVPWVAVAKILRPHGLAGTMRLQPFSRHVDEILESGVEQFHIRRGGEILGPFTLTEGRPALGILMVKFAEIADRTAAEAFTNAELVVAEDDLWDPPEDYVYIHDLRGLEVRSADSGEVLGTVKDAQEGAAHDFLVLKLDAAPGKSTLLPIIPQFVPKIEVAGGFVEVVIPEGLLE